MVVQLGRERYEQLFDADTDARLRALADVTGPFAAGGAAGLAPEVTRADVLFLPGGTHVPRSLLAEAPRLRWIGDTSGGPPRLDYAYAAERGIVVTDCRRAFSPAVGEMALALYLAVLRDVVVHDRALHTPDLPEGVDKERNQEAFGRTIGFVGFGGIARSLQRFLAPFDPRLLVHDPFVPDAAIRAAGAEPAALDDLLRRADAIFLLAVPTSENKTLLGPAELDLLRRDSVLLVISRSWLVDEAALIERLRAGRFRAAMDVFDVEPLPPGHAYRSLPNVVLTPHRAGGTLGSYRRIGRGLVDDLERFLRSEPPTDNAVVTLEAARLQGRLTSD
ncbi:MAG TPA: NAD(P)-dependent oxidoreductase [Chloroflexota bacterium]|nr:NAD(P)-dependent oxidoreductase [Chloroflexota bacterium]